MKSVAPRLVSNARLVVALIAFSMTGQQAFAQNDWNGVLVREPTQGHGISMRTGAGPRQWPVTRCGLASSPLLITR